MGLARGEGTYTLERVENAPQGTSVVLHLKPADPDNQLHDYTSVWKIKEIVKRYSDFITWPIRLVGEQAAKDAKGGGRGRRRGRRARDAELHEGPVGTPARRGVRGRVPRAVQAHRPRLAAAGETIQLHAEGTFEYQALLFLPSHAPHDLYQQNMRHGLQLYVKRVFIMDDCEALLPGGTCGSSRAWSTRRTSRSTCPARSSSRTGTSG